MTGKSPTWIEPHLEASVQVVELPPDTGSQTAASIHVADGIKVMEL